MKYGIFSDVHGNIEALTAVLEHLEKEGAERYAFLGDAVGYGANPNEVCDAIRNVADIAVLGNHDAAVTGRMAYDDYYDAAKRALDWCREQLSDDNMAWLTGLPYKEREGIVEFSHGAPCAPEVFDYLFVPEQVAVIPEDELADVTFIGHSHLTIAFRIRAGLVTPIVSPEIDCREGEKTIITAGSVGQPRDRDPRTCCGIFDTETRIFRFTRLEYDILTVRDKILAAGLAPVFGERLLVGM